MVNRNNEYSDDAWEMLKMFHPGNGKYVVVRTDSSSACEAQRSGGHLRRGGQWREKVEDCRYAKSGEACKANKVWRLCVLGECLYIIRGSEIKRYL